MRALGFARFAVVRHDRGGRVAHRTARDYPVALERTAGSPWRCPRPWLRALTTSLIEAQRLGSILCRAHLRGRRPRGADRRQASLSKADLRETDLGTADLMDGCGAHHARRGQGISKEGYGAGLAVSE